MFYHHENFWLSNQNINDEDLSLAEKLNQNGITNGILNDTNNFIHIDGNVITCGILTKNDTVQTILNKEYSDEDNLVCTDDINPTKS